MKTKKNFNFPIEDEMYSIPFHIIVGDKEYYKKIIEKKFDCRMEVSDNQGGETMVLDSKDGGIIITIWFPRLDFTISNHGVIAHELLHATFQASRMIGIKFDFENQEPIVYYFEYLFERTTEKLMKVYRKN